MKNKKLDEIKDRIVDLLKSEFGYCGAAEGDMQVMLNSGNGDDNFVILIKDQSD